MRTSIPLAIFEPNAFFPGRAENELQPASGAAISEWHASILPVLGGAKPCHRSIQGFAKPSIESFGWGLHHRSQPREQS